MAGALRREATMVGREDELFVCEECGFRYREEELAEECEEWCGEHNSCNMDLAKKSVGKEE